MLTLTRFTADHFAMYRQWCEEPEARRWLGVPDEAWLAYVTTSFISWTWLAYDGSQPVGCVQIDQHEDDPAQASIAFIVPLEQRRKGYATRMILMALGQWELTAVRTVYAFVEPDNHVSRALLLRCGFVLADETPDAEGFLHFTYTRKG
jgi:RimJ/RimL family protein N-acetyltransferase